MGPENTSDDSFDRELPSSEELEALLGSTAAEMGATEFESSEEYGARFLDDVPPRILLASRSDHDLEVLAGFLGKRQVEMAVTRNPFTALDYLRARLFHGVITDYSMWAAQGALLFRRMMKDLDNPVRVVFICDSDRADLAGARRSAAVDVLERPLRDESIAGAVDLLCNPEPVAGQGKDDLDSDGPSPDELASLSRHDDETKATEMIEPRQRAPVPGPIATSARERPVDDAASVSTANSWYRFFFEARRVLRLQARPQRRREHVFELLLATHGAAAAAVVRYGDKSGSGVHPCSIRTAYLDRGLSRDSRAQELKRLFELLAGLPDALLASPGESSPLVSRSALVVPYVGVDHSDNLLAILPSSGRLLTPPPAAVVEELPILLREIASLSTDNAN
jgi:DNA-binding NarL/FixJ family response regulator